MPLFVTSHRPALISLARYDTHLGFSLRFRLKDSRYFCASSGVMNSNFVTTCGLGLGFIPASLVGLFPYSTRLSIHQYKDMSNSKADLDQKGLPSHMPYHMPYRGRPFLLPAFTATEGFCPAGYSRPPSGTEAF